MPKHLPPVVPYVGPPSKHSGNGNKPITRIVMHGTVSETKKGGARAIAAYFRSDRARGSAHYIVDPGEVVQVAYDSVVAWHAPPNPHSIGIELCDLVGGAGGKPLPKARWADQPHQDMLRLAARLVAELCLAYSVPVRLIGPYGVKTNRSGICEHSDVSEGLKQSAHWDLGEFPRRTFLKMVKAEVAEIQSGSPTGKPITLASTANRGTAAKPSSRDVVEGAVRRARARLRKRSVTKRAAASSASQHAGHAEHADKD